MKSNIFVPKIINVGYQEREDTYTGKLAYVVYTDEKGVLRKQASWDGWRNHSIEPEEFDNVPTSGFVLNKKVGGEKSHWNFRHTYCRIYDPRGFEFEITIENLLYILENTNSIVGKGLEGEFVYGWDGKNLVLIPTCSPDYAEIEEYNALMFSEQVITGDDIEVGKTYRGKDNELYLYLGKYQTYSSIYKYNDISTNKGKQFWFVKFKNKDALNNFDVSSFKFTPDAYILQKKSLSNKFLISLYDNNVSPYLSDLLNFIESMPELSPVDMDNIKVNFFSKDAFHKYVIDWWTGWTKLGMIHSPDLPFCSKPHNNVANNYYLALDRTYDFATMTHEVKGLFLCRYKTDLYTSFRGSTRLNGFASFSDKEITDSVIDEIYYLCKPCYIDVFLKNGKKYKTEYNYLPKQTED